MAGALQAIGGLVDSFCDLPVEKELPVEAVTPLVVGANEPDGRPAVGGADPAAAMTAGIVERADFSVEIADQHDAMVADLDREEGARLVELAIVSDEQPVPAPDRFHFGSEDAGIEIERLG